MNNTLAIFYASLHGQAEKIARRIGDVAAIHGANVVIFDVRDPAVAKFNAENYAAAILVSSVHFGRHSRAATTFVSRKLAALSLISSGFVSVSGAAANLHGDEEAQRYLHRFLTATGWQPDSTLSAAGAVPYSRYGFLTRKLMQFASRVAGRDSDASRDYEYTDWFAVEDFTRRFLTQANLLTKRAQAS